MDKMRNVFKFNALIAFGAIATFLTVTGFARAGKQDFILHNQTGVEIHEVYVSAVSSNDWEEDVLGKETLADGESIKITFEDHEKHVHWNLKIVDGKGNSIEWHDLNLMEIAELTLHYKDGKAWADVK
jgi:hypothetical protein